MSDSMETKIKLKIITLTHDDVDGGVHEYKCGVYIVVNGTLPPPIFIHKTTCVMSDGDTPKTIEKRAHEYTANEFAIKLRSLLI